jgi:hypothetical protein
MHRVWSNAAPDAVRAVGKTVGATVPLGPKFAARATAQPPSVVPIDEGADISFELPDRDMNTALELLPGELSETALDLIDP